MGHWLQNFDRISFWLGFLAASLFWWLIRLLGPAVSRFSQNLRAGARITHQERALADEVRFGNDVLRKAQGWHLAAALYSLDDVLVQPQLLAPPQLPDAYEPSQDDDITDRTIPYLIDDPELASFYHAPKLGLSEALQGGANLVIVGVPGSGKSVALASLACEQLRKQEGGHTSTRTPLLIHIGELGMPFREDLNAEEELIVAAAAFADSVPKKRLPGVIHTLLKDERVLLLLDGLDELVPSQLEDASRLLEDLLAAHPGIQIVTTAHLGNLGRLPSLGFQPLTLANWGNTERHQLISRWAELWQIHTRSQSHKPTSEPDPLLVTGWLLNSSSALSPLELTLKVWGAFAGDSLGPDEGAVIEAHIRRMTFGQPARNHNGLEQLASQVILSMDPVPTREAAEHWLSGKQDTAARTNNREEAERQIGSGESDFAETVRAAGALPDLLECGILIPRSAESISLAHPIFTAYLASRRLRSGDIPRTLAAQPEWCGRTSTLKYLAIFDQRAEWIAEMLRFDDENPLLEALFQAAHWLPGSLEGSIWTDQVMRRLAICLQTEGHPISLRFRALSALVQSKQPGVSLLLRQLAIQKGVESQQLAALGLGYLRDVKSIEILSRQCDHPKTNLSRAALLALVSMGENAGLEAVGKILLRGDEAISKDAAEALANDIGEGHDFLLECTELENPNVRRAAVFGLGRTRDPKFEKVLESLSTEDNQWIVQDAAKQQLKQLHDVHSHSPARLPELPQTPWLIEFASEREVGVAPGKPAFQLLERAVIEGNIDQRLAAIFCLGISGNPAAALPLQKAFAAGEKEIQDAVYTGLWNLAACGISIDP